MIDSEKVIKGLECCLVQSDEVPPLCEECPYCDEKIGSCEYFRDILTDALALLKEQEPRVMTLEEAINGNQVGYVEFRYHPDRGWVKCDFTLKDEVAMLLNTGRTFYQEITDYNHLYRLWTNRPTYEQMRDTPWTE